MQIQWAQSAISNLASIYEHILADSPRYALAVVDRLNKRTRGRKGTPEEKRGGKKGTLYLFGGRMRTLCLFEK